MISNSAGQTAIFSPIETVSESWVRSATVSPIETISESAARTVTVSPIETISESLDQTATVSSIDTISESAGQTATVSPVVTSPDLLPASPGRTVSRSADQTITHSSVSKSVVQSDAMSTIRTRADSVTDLPVATALPSLSGTAAISLSLSSAVAAAESNVSGVLLPVVGALFAALAIACFALFVFCKWRGNRSDYGESEGETGVDPTGAEMVTDFSAEQLNLISLYQEPKSLDCDGHDEPNPFVDIFCEGQ
jgi:hypothetical protein